MNNRGEAGNKLHFSGFSLCVKDKNYFFFLNFYSFISVFQFYFLSQSRIALRNKDARQTYYHLFQAFYNFKLKINVKQPGGGGREPDRS